MHINTCKHCCLVNRWDQVSRIGTYEGSHIHGNIYRDSNGFSSAYYDSLINARQTSISFPYNLLK